MKSKDSLLYGYYIWLFMINIRDDVLCFKAKVTNVKIKAH